jgi:hypothetical protein
LGHSPMAPSTPVSGQEESRIPTARDVEIAGGIWNPSSAKRDKIAELKVELLEHQYTLDDAATEQQARDLHLADGVQWIVHTVDTCRIGPEQSSMVTEVEEPLDLHLGLDPTRWELETSLANVQNWIKEQETSIHSTVPDGMLNQQQWETYLTEAVRKIDEQLATLPSGRYLRDVRDFYPVPLESKNALGEVQDKISDTPEQKQLMNIAGKCVARYRLLLAKATCEHLIEAWDKCTTLSDAALDRLAVKTGGDLSEEESTITTMSMSKANQILQTCLVGNAQDRFDAMWALMDRNNDGLLEKADMEKSANFALVPVQQSLLSL